MTLIANFDIHSATRAAASQEPPFVIESETPAGHLARERLLDAAFGAARFDKAVGRLREGRPPAQGLALVAKAGEGLVGTIRLWHISAGGVPALLLGPLAVAKAYRSRGIGRRLMMAALSGAARKSHAAVLALPRARTQGGRFGWRARPRDGRRCARPSKR